MRTEFDGQYEISLLNSNKLVIKAVSYTTDGEYLWGTDYTYDGNGYSILEYDENDNLIRESQMDADGTKHIVEYGADGARLSDRTEMAALAVDV